MVDAIRDARQQICARRREPGTTYRCSLGNGTGEKANKDRASKGRWCTDPTPQSIFHWQARGYRKTMPGWLSQKRLECMGALTQQAWRQTYQLSETAGERANTVITHLETNIGHAERSRQKQTPSRLKA